MPTISSYVSDEFAEAVGRAAGASSEKRIAPWIAEACRQRLERDGMLPGSAEAEARAKFDEALKRHGAAPLVAAIESLADSQLTSPTAP